MSDAQQFLDTYQQTLTQELDTSDWPPELTSLFTIDGCLKHSEEKAVYVVTDTRTGGKAVLRVAPEGPESLADAEGRILSMLDHPGIPKTYGMLTSPGKRFIIREYIYGEALDLAVAQRRFSVQEVFALARNLCLILRYLHAQNPPVIHRDIKPQNIILKPDGTLVLTDFGIARVFKPGADSDTHYMGTMPYAPPEQYGYAQSTAQTDIYALGIVLVYLMTGSPNRYDLAAKIPDKKMLALINRCIAFDPAHRFASVEEIIGFIDGKRQPNKKALMGVLLGAAGFVVLVVLALVLFFFVLQPSGLFGGVSSGAAADSSTAAQNVPTIYDAAMGNTTGNIMNGGFAVDGGGKTYVYYDEALYTVDKEGSIQLLAPNVGAVTSLNYHDGALYFESDNELRKVSVQTGEISRLWDFIAGKIFIYEDTLYFSHTEDQEKLSSLNVNSAGITEYDHLEPAEYTCVVDGYAYYLDLVGSEGLYRVNLTAGGHELLYEGYCDYAVVYDSKIYINPAGSPQMLIRMNLDGSNVEELLEGNFGFLDVNALGIFYTTGYDWQLERVSLDGKNRTVLVPNDCGAFCVTENWVFYSNYEGGYSDWMVRIDGTDRQPFDPQEAATFQDSLDSDEQA